VKDTEKANKTLTRELKNNSRFASFLKEALENPLVQKQSLASLLILPVQRIPRYLMLAKDLLKKTDSTHKDYELIKKSIDLIMLVTKDVDEGIHENNQRETVLDINRRFTERSNIVDPSRLFIKEGELVKICRNSKKKYIFLLFSDLLIYASPVKTGGGKLKLHRRIEINEGFKVLDLDDTENEKNIMQIITSIKSFDVVAETPHSKKAWLDAFTKTRASNRQQSESSDVNYAPVWQTDVSSNDCYVCKIKFSVFRRRHHCRKCGSLVCNECSKGRTIDKNNERVRVCDYCRKFEPKMELERIDL